MKTNLISRAALAALLAGCTDQRSLPTEIEPALRFTTYNAAAAAAFALSGDNGSSSAFAVGINNLGTIAGFDASFRALRWETGIDGVPASLSPTIVAPGNAFDVNDAGQFIGRSVVSFSDAATLWTPTGPNTYTATVVGLPGSFDSQAEGINSRGQVVGTSRVLVGSVLAQKCFLWTPTSDNASTGSVEELAGLGGENCVAHDINSESQVVGASTTPGSNVAQAFVYGGGVTTALAADRSDALAINDGGQIIGVQLGSSVMWNPVAAGWSAATPVSVPALSGQSGFIQSWLVDINNAGFVVGRARDNAGLYRAFIWNSGAVTELPGGDSPSIEARSLTNVVNNRIIVAGAKTNPITLDPIALRWTVSITPVVTEGCNDRLLRLVDELKSAGALTSGVAASILSKVDAASRQAAAGRIPTARNILAALSEEVDALQKSQKLTPAQADSLKDPLSCVMSAL